MGIILDPDIPLLEICSADLLTQMRKDEHEKCFTAAASSSGTFKTLSMSVRFVKWIKVQS